MSVDIKRNQIISSYLLNAIVHVQIYECLDVAVAARSHLFIAIIVH